MVGVTDFTAGVIGALVGAIVGGAFAIAAGVIAARVQAKRTEEIALELRRQERRGEALWELDHRLREIRVEMYGAESFADIEGLIDQLDGRWRSHLASAIRSGPIAEGYVEVREEAGFIRSQGATFGPKGLDVLIDELLDVLHAEMGDADGE